MIQLVMSLICSKLGIFGILLAWAIPLPFGIVIIAIIWWNIRKNEWFKKRPILYAYLMYYISAVILMQLLRMGFCKARDAVMGGGGPMPGGFPMPMPGGFPMPMPGGFPMPGMR